MRLREGGWFVAPPQALQDLRACQVTAWYFTCLLVVGSVLTSCVGTIEEHALAGGSVHVESSNHGSVSDSSVEAVVGKGDNAIGRGETIGGESATSSNPPTEASADATVGAFVPIVPDEAPHTGCYPLPGLVPPPWAFWPWTALVKWSPSGAEILFSRGSALYAVTADGSRLWEVASAAVDGEIEGESVGEMVAFDIAPDGTHVVFSTCAYPRLGTERAGRPPRIEDYAYELALTTLDGAMLQRLTMNRGFDSFPAWSPDGRRIAFLHEFADEFRGRAARVVTMAADGSDMQHVLTGAIGMHPPVWSPDGHRFAVTATIGDAKARIYILDADGPRLRLLHELQPLGETQSGPAWSPDGERLAFLANDGETLTINRIDIDGSSPGRVTTSVLRAGVPRPTILDNWVPTPSWSPEGDHLLYTCARRVCVVALDGTLVGQSPIELETGSVGAWSPDGARIAVAPGTDLIRPWRAVRHASGPALYTMAPNGSDVRVLAVFDADGEVRTADPPQADS